MEYCAVITNQELNWENVDFFYKNDLYHIFPFVQSQVCARVCLYTNTLTKQFSVVTSEGFSQQIGGAEPNTDPHPRLSWCPSGGFGLLPVSCTTAVIIMLT